ncbi:MULTISPECIES: hypothetical protein [unclassified Methylobacterium]|jgi:hypothetical protein|uniref:hypothetical protein n=1 Tax=unclassified Methylobacterium TaxID=2615210 RepID=UPI001921A9B0|nr:hypothetical protein [Methylobacterium sp. 2A]
MPGLFLEDFTDGLVIDADWRRAVTEADNVLFCGMAMTIALCTRMALTRRRLVEERR